MWPRAEADEALSEMTGLSFFGANLRSQPFGEQRGASGGLRHAQLVSLLLPTTCKGRGPPKNELHLRHATRRECLPPTEAASPFSAGRASEKASDISRIGTSRECR